MNAFVRNFKVNGRRNNTIELLPPGFYYRSRYGNRFYYWSLKYKLDERFSWQRFYKWQHLSPIISSSSSASNSNGNTANGCSSSSSSSSFRSSGLILLPAAIRNLLYGNCYLCRSCYHHRFSPSGSFYTIRNFHITSQMYDQPSSKVEVTVQNIKNKQKEKVEEIMKEAATATATAEKYPLGEAACSPAPAVPLGAETSTAGKVTAATATATTTATAQAAGRDVDIVQKPAQMKKSLKTRIWEEVLHYYHGFRLLVIDINICRKLLWQILNGKTLTRRENRLLLRTTSDLFRLIPFSVFIIVPFMELLLPIFIKLFPGLMPSTFQTDKERENKLKQSVQVRLEMIKFLQKTLDEMAVVHKREHKSEEAKQFDMFFQRIKNPSEYVSNDEIIKYAKRFEDEITLDSLSREQLVPLCRVLELNTMGTTNFLRFQLRLKLRSLAADDRVIAREGVSSLDLWELQQACKARGMRAYGLTEDRMRTQLQEWIDLSLNERVPPTLLLLSRTMLISDNTITTDTLKETIRVLPQSLATQTKAAIGESEGKIDNKTQIQVIKDEVRKIKEEREEEREEERQKQRIKASAATKDEQKSTPPIMHGADPEELKDIAKTIATDTASVLHATAADAQQHEATASEEKSISSKDMALLNEALKSLSSDKKMVVEKETLKEIKEELEEYKEDVQELREVGQAVQEPIAESRAAKLLFNKVNKMIGQLDKVIDDLELKQKSQKETIKESIPTMINDELVCIEDLVKAVKKIKQTSDESRLAQIVNVLSKLDADKDGAITVDEVRKVMEAIARENVKLNEKQLEELIDLLGKEQILEAEEKIEKALAKSQKEIEEQKKVAAAQTEHPNPSIITEMKTNEQLLDTATIVKDKCQNMNIIDKKNNLKMDKSDVDKSADLLKTPDGGGILTKSGDVRTTIRTTPSPPPTPQATQVNTKDKML